MGGGGGSTAQRLAQQRPLLTVESVRKEGAAGVD